MADICTLAIITAATIQQCWQPPDTCFVPPGVLQTCGDPKLLSCGGAGQSIWQCKREDGFSYWITGKTVEEGVKSGLLKEVTP